MKRDLLLTFVALLVAAPVVLCAATEDASKDHLEVVRFANNPIIRPEMLPGHDGGNINGPSLMRAPAWLAHPLGKYYLYFASHSGKYIRLAYADQLQGPWKIHEPGTLKLEEAPGCKGHIASPDMVVDNERKEIRMYFHGPSKESKDQKSFVAVSGDGLHFKASAEVLGIFYWRVFRWDGWWYAMGKGGTLYRSRDGLTGFEEGPNPFPPGELQGKREIKNHGVRHVALLQEGSRLWIYYTNMGDAPERIFRCHLELAGDWKSWKTSKPEEVLRPETEWEGARLPVKESANGAAEGAENALRDPCIFVEDGRVYLLYSVAGERGIAIAECRNAAAAERQTQYQPTRESLSQHRVPEWYQDAKIGFFYHWGPQSVVGDKFDQDALEFCRAQGKYAGTHLKNPPGQWGATMYPKPGKPERQQNGAYLLHKKWYGDPKQFGYKDLIPLLTGERFDPEGMVKLLDEAGVKYIAPMAVHHDGFAMWDSKVIGTFNAARIGPKLDTTRLVIEAARKRGMKVGVSTHVMRHSWYYPKLEGYDTSDPRYVELYGEGIGPGGLPKPAAIEKWEDTLKELIDTFHPDYIFSDGDTADIFCSTGSHVCTEAFRRIVAYYYNSARAWGGEPVITFKRESLYKEEAVPDYEGGKLFDIAPYKWQTHSSICGWFYRNGERVTPSRTLFRDILDVVSKNGNMLISLGLKGNGDMQECEVAFLKDMATWTHVVGEGIFASRPWLVYGELEPGQAAGEVELDKKGIVFDDPATVRRGRLKLHEGDIRYTRSKDGRTIYAARLSWPERPFTLTSFAANGVGKGVKVASVSLLGSKAGCTWKRADTGITITPPAQSVFEDKSWPVILKIETQ